MTAPLPPRFANALATASDTNPGLLFDRGADCDWLLYDKDGVVGKEGAKGKFLTAFCKAYARHSVGAEGDPFVAHLTRRELALEQMGAHRLERKTTSRLVIGLGLPQPVDTGFLFDRLTGVPYLPGSSLKGLLRQTARLVAAGELAASKEDCAFWTAERDAIFGPAIEAGTTPRKGKLVVYEAFPIKWPKLAVEVLTPHHAQWFGDGKPPGDWEDPTPVPFLSIEAGETFRFYFRVLGFEEDRDAMRGRIERLLDLGLDWLGVGGKRTSGFGVFAGSGGAAAQGEPPKRKESSVAPPSLESLDALVKGLGLNDAADRVPRILDRFATDPKPAAKKIVETLGKGWKDAKHREKPWAARLREILEM